jgi:alanine racemase
MSSTAPSAPGSPLPSRVPARIDPLREAQIDHDVLRANLVVLRRLVAPAELMAVVKADAYGHGAVPIARTALEAGASRLGVADIPEALALRTAGIDAPILAWLHGEDADFAAALAAGIELGLSSLVQLEAVADAVSTGAPGPAVVQLKLDTGLSRNGCAPADWPGLVARAAALEAEGVVRVAGVFSHLSNTDAATDSQQRAAFDAGLAVAEQAGLRPALRHLASSQAAIAAPDLRYDLVRVGIAMYGVQPDASIDLAALGIRPVMELAGAVAAVRRVPAGAGVSYGHTHRTGAETTLALVPLGYADGVPRHASNRAEVAIEGVRYPVVGRIAMDQFVVDVGDDDVEVGDRVVLWGDPADGVPTADDWAAAADTIGYEIVTRVGPRVPRTHVGYEMLRVARRPVAPRRPEPAAGTTAGTTAPGPAAP